MIWLHPAAWIGLATLAAPILIHILVQRKAERLPFPTLRFIQPTRLVAIRRHVLEDPWLLALRAGILVAAVAALAAPLLLTAARRDAWNARTVHATVVDDAARGLAPPIQPRPFLSQSFDTGSLPDGIHRAVVWLENAPPARREIVVVSPLPLGSLTSADVAAIPAEVGIRFERAGTLPAERTIPGGRVLATASGGLAVLQQTVALNGTATGVHEALVSDGGSFPVDVVGGSARPAIVAVLSQRVWTVPAGRRARLVLAGAASDEAAVAGAGLLSQPWMADAAASIARDGELQSAAAGTPVGLVDARFGAAPWMTVATAADGRPLATSAGSTGGLIVVSAADASDIVTPLLLRAIADGLASPPDLRAAEVVPIPDAQLHAWTRPALPVAITRLDRVERDDRRWLWGLVLMLLVAESWARRARRAGADEPEERARVA